LKKGPPESTLVVDERNLLHGVFLLSLLFGKNLLHLLVGLLKLVEKGRRDGKEITSSERDNLSGLCRTSTNGQYNRKRAEQMRRFVRTFRKEAPITMVS